MSKNDDVNKLIVIDKCILILITSCKLISIFLGNTLEDNYNSYKSNINSNKKKKYLNNINNNIESIIKIEKKKYNGAQIDKIVNECKSFLKECNIDNMINNSYYKYLDSLINKNIKEIINNLIKEYEIICNGNKKIIVTKKIIKKEEIILPKISEEKKKEISYLKINDLIYMHMKALNVSPFMEFDYDSFLLEKELFNKSLEDKTLYLFNDLNKYELSKLAPFEKKRRNYVRNMFDTDLKILNIGNDTEDYFKICTDIINNLYIELNDFDNNDSNLDRLIKNTKASFGGKRQLEIYMKVLNNKDISTLNDNNINKPTIYEDIKNTIPTFEDIIKILNNRIIDKISLNVDNYINNIDKLFDLVCEYMSVDEIIAFYKKIIETLKAISLKKNMNNYIVKLQEFVCKKIKSMICISDDEIIKEYLKEEKLF